MRLSAAPARARRRAVDLLRLRRARRLAGADAMTLAEVRPPEAVVPAGRPDASAAAGRAADRWEVHSEVDGVRRRHRARSAAPRSWPSRPTPSVQGGALGIDSCRAIAEATDLAVARGVPVVGVWQSGGARLREGVGSLDGVARRLRGADPRQRPRPADLAWCSARPPAVPRTARRSPTSSSWGRPAACSSPAPTSSAGSPARTSPRSGSAAPDTHTRTSGVVHLEAATDDEALYAARRLVSLLGAQGTVDRGLDRRPRPRPARARRAPPRLRRAPGRCAPCSTPAASWSSSPAGPATR